MQEPGWWTHLQGGALGVYRIPCRAGCFSEKEYIHSLPTNLAYAAATTPEYGCQVTPVAQHACSSCDPHRHAAIWSLLACCQGHLAGRRVLANVGKREANCYFSISMSELTLWSSRCARSFKVAAACSAVRHSPSDLIVGSNLPARLLRRVLRVSCSLSTVKNWVLWLMCSVFAIYANLGLEHGLGGNIPVANPE